MTEETNTQTSSSIDDISMANKQMETISVGGEQTAIGNSLKSKHLVNRQIPFL
jgi:hypothetical protein